MRYRKKDLSRNLSILNQVNQKFRKIGMLDSQAAVNELVKCQSIAIEMGTTLEALGEIAVPVVHLLEDYCESLYQQSVYLNNVGECRKLSKKVQRQLVQISNAIQYELPDEKKEIVFLPYKASMWDSLESVWMAAQEDKNCEALVVPVPYFDKNPDGTLGQMHDEKDQYPEYVPITDWQRYDMKERRPDAVYIHNPYDECNYVTSVHPAFYARELKKYTDMLVYIPYFVGINNSLEEHFCVQPGTIYADRVIVESEAVRKIYLDAYQRFEQANHCKGIFGDANQKFQALGSPKLDRVRKIMREGVEVPGEWEQMMFKEDGSRKKVVLYNTTVEAFLRYSEAALRKIKYTLRTFESSQEVVLLWRPHPLLLQTAYSMRMGLYQELWGMIQAYREAHWGIYDDTADVERAIVLSDAYYGDWSSVVTLYQATGKPIMIQDYEEDWRKI